MQHLKEYIQSKYKLRCELDIDLKIYSSNVEEIIVVSPVDDEIYIKYNEYEIVSSRKMMYKDISYLLDNLAYVYFLSPNNDLLNTLVWSGDSERTLIDDAEDYIWKMHNDMNIEKVFVMHFYGEYNFEATVSGSFIDTYWQIYDESHYKVVDEAIKRYKYREKEGYVERYKSLLTYIIPSEYNLKFIRKYFLDQGFLYLLDYRDRDEDIKDIYQMIDFSFDTANNIAGDKYMIMSSDFESVILVEGSKIYMRGKIALDYPTLDKILQVDKEPCRYIHSLKTSRVLYEGTLYEASGKTISECLNKLNKLLDGKIVCCFTCKYGNYTIDEKNIYCLNGFHPKDFPDVLYIVDETKMIPYDQFNLCDMYRIPSKDNYQHTLFKAVNEDE